MSAVKRKKTLAYFENCSAVKGLTLVTADHRINDLSLSHLPAKNLGINVIRLYLLVLT